MGWEVTASIDFCYGHRLLDYDGKCRHLHGHNGRAEVTLAAEVLDSRGMVYDFTEIKRQLKGWIDRELDHKLVLRRDDRLAEVLAAEGEPLYLMDLNPTAEAIAREILRRGRAMDLPIVRVRLWETPTSHATYAEALPARGEDA